MLRTKFTANDKHVIVAYHDSLVIHNPDGSVEEHIGSFLDPEVVFDMLPDQNVVATIECDYGTGTDNIKSINISTHAVENTVVETPSVLWQAEMSPDNKKFMLVQTGFAKSFDLETDQFEELGVKGGSSNGGFSYNKKLMLSTVHDPASSTFRHYVINLADNKVLFETNAADIKDISPSLKYVATTGYGETLPVISVATVKDPSIPVWDNKSESASHRGILTTISRR